MRADVYVMSKPNVRFSGVVDSIGFGVTPDADVIGRLGPGLPDVQRTLNWVRLAARYPVRVRVRILPPNCFGSANRRSLGDSRTLSVASLAQSLRQSGSVSSWLWDFLKGELTPYPGRAGDGHAHGHCCDSRDDRLHDLSCSLRISRGDYALLISRETPRATLQSAGTIFLATGLGAAYVLVSAWFVISLPSSIFSGTLVRSSWDSMRSASLPITVPPLRSLL